jgi:hypothetical protein
MKATSFLGLAVFLCASLAQAEQPLLFPAKKPLVGFLAPDDWKAQMKSGSLFVVSPDGGDVIVEVMTMEAGIDDDAAALKEAKSVVEGDFKNLTLTATDPAEANGLTVTLYGGAGEDDSGPAMINMAILKHPQAQHPILFCLIAAKFKAAEHGAACGAMMNSIQAASPAKPKAKAPPAAAAELQTYSYPNKQKPDFTVDFPAEWKMQEKKDNGGVYVESPDKLVAVNVIMVPAAELGEAVADLKKSVGERFTEAIKWNGGEKPEVVKDDALGLTTTFHNAVASDGEGTEKYSVNIVTYVRKTGDPSLMLICQNPLKALDKHGDAMEAMIQSIKVR